MNRYFAGIYEYVKSLEIIDTHEHLAASNARRNQDNDVITEYISQYFGRDLISAGLSVRDYAAAVTNGILSVREKWLLLEPYWECCRHTGYGQSLDISVRDLYGIERIGGDTVEALDKAFRATLGDDQFRFVLKQKSKIVTSLLDKDYSLDSDRNLFTPVCRIDSMIRPATGREINALENCAGLTITCFEDYLEACEHRLDKLIQDGAKVLKSALAYVRSLEYGRVEKADAEADFNKFFFQQYCINKNDKIYTSGDRFQNFMMHYLLRLIGRRAITLQIHTGIQEGNGNNLDNSNPRHLNRLFLEYPDVNFDIFHMGYPYQNELAALCKNLPNVYIDMCWAHVISPPVCRTALGEWLESVPINKISAFGGDYAFIDGVYGHQYIARRNVAQTLSGKVADGLFDEKQAMNIARMIFHDNPCRLFGLDA